MTLTISHASKLWRRLVYEIHKFKYGYNSGDPFIAVATALPMPQKCDLPSQDSNTFKGIFNDGFLWSWHRTSIERRLMRKIGSPSVLRPKRNLFVCDVCGHHYEAHTVCGNCWKRVKQETDAMQEAIQNELQLKPVEKEVVVLYNNDACEKNHEGKIIVEIPRERPHWFSKNLLTKANL